MLRKDFTIFKILQILVAVLLKPGKDTSSNYLYGNEDMSEILATDATTIYFDGKVCGENPSLNDAGTQLEYSAQIGEFLT